MARCTLEIDLAKIRANYQILYQICNKGSSSVEVGAAIKANSYGLGIEKIVPVLYQEGCRNFFAASIEEGITASSILGNSKANIFVLYGVSHKEEANELVHYGLIPVLNHLEQIKIWQEAAITHNLKLPASLHLDTGLHRFGMPAKEIEQLINNPSLLEGINVHSIISHLSAGMEPNNPYNSEQLKKFQRYLQYFPKAKASLSNSSVLFLNKEYYFDLVRPGGAIYGITKPDTLQQTFKLTAPIIQIHQVPANNSIGYNMTFITKRSTLVAVLPIGYADGYLRAFSSQGEVFISNYRAPVIGRVSMDLINIDVTDIPAEKVFLGAEAEIIGDTLTVDRMASLINASSYEILTTLTKSNRYKRVYKDYVYN